MIENAFNKILDVMVGLLAAIPVPDFLTTNSVTLHPSILWGLDIIQADVGVGVLVSAYSVRFLIRRLPFIG